MIAPFVAGAGVLATGAMARAAVGRARQRAVTGRLPAAMSSDQRLLDRRARLRLPEPPPRVAAALADAVLGVPPDMAWTAWLGALVAGPLSAALLGGPGLAGVTLLGVATGPVLAVRARRGAAGARLERSLPAALEAVARGLRSGGSLRQAVAEAGASTASGPHLGAELSRAATEAAQGVGLVRALEGIAVRRPLPGVRLAVAALCLGAETGGAQARAVDGVAATVRERLAVTAELRALSSQARISALVIGLAPLGFGAFAAATDPRTSRFLLRTPAGLCLLGVGLALDGLGWLWMQRLARVVA